MKNRHPTRQNYLETFEVSESTFKRDIALMRDRMGAPVAYDPESGGYVEWAVCDNRHIDVLMDAIFQDIISASVL